MDNQQMGTVGLSRKSVEQLERLIDIADTVLYPAHLMIGGWRMFFAAVLLALYGICYGLWWIADSIYHNGLVNTAISIVNMAGQFPITAVIVGLVIVVPVFIILLPVAGWFTQLMYILWVRIFGINRKPGLVSGAEIISRGLNPDDFTYEKVNGVIYGRRRGA